MLLAGRGYKADWIDLAMKNGAWANILLKSNRSDPFCFRPSSTALATGWSASSKDETMSSGVATRYDRLAANFLALVKLASIKSYGCTLMNPRPNDWAYARRSSTLPLAF